MLTSKFSNLEKMINNLNDGLHNLSVEVYEMKKSKKWAYLIYLKCIILLIYSHGLFGYLLFKIFNSVYIVINWVVRQTKHFLHVRVCEMRLHVLVLLFDRQQRLLQLAEVAVVFLEQFVF